MLPGSNGVSFNPLDAVDRAVEYVREHGISGADLAEVERVLIGIAPEVQDLPAETRSMLAAAVVAKIEKG